MHNYSKADEAGDNPGEARHRLGDPLPYPRRGEVQDAPGRATEDRRGRGKLPPYPTDTDTSHRPQDAPQSHGMREAEQTPTEDRQALREGQRTRQAGRWREEQTSRREPDRMLRRCEGRQSRRRQPRTSALGRDTTAEADGAQSATERATGSETGPSGGDDGERVRQTVRAPQRATEDAQQPQRGKDTIYKDRRPQSRTQSPTEAREQRGNMAHPGRDQRRRPKRTRHTRRTRNP